MHLGQKAHIGVNARTGLTQRLSTTAANVHDITETEYLLHGEERFTSADLGYRGAQKREELKDSKADCLIAEMPSKVHLLKKRPRVDKQSLRTEYVKASIQAKVEHPFQIIKLAMLFALANVFRIDQMIRAARD